MNKKNISTFIYGVFMIAALETFSATPIKAACSTYSNPVACQVNGCTWAGPKCDGPPVCSNYAQGQCNAYQQAQGCSWSAGGCREKH